MNTANILNTICEVSVINSDDVISGIYMIFNHFNLKMYIGKSVDIYNRWYQHINELLTNNHDNHYLQNSFNKYGYNNFSFFLIEKCEVENLLDREDYYIKHYNSINRKHGYNLRLENNTYYSLPKKEKNENDIERFLKIINKYKSIENLLINKKNEDACWLFKIITFEYFGGYRMHSSYSELKEFSKQYGWESIFCDNFCDISVREKNDKKFNDLMLFINNNNGKIPYDKIERKLSDFLNKLKKSYSENSKFYTLYLDRLSKQGLLWILEYNYDRHQRQQLDNIKEVVDYFKKGIKLPEKLLKFYYYIKTAFNPKWPGIVYQSTLDYLESQNMLHILHSEERGGKFPLFLKFYKENNRLPKRNSDENEKSLAIWWSRINNGQLKECNVVLELLKKENLDWLMEFKFNSKTLKSYNNLIEVLSFCESHGYIPRLNISEEHEVATKFEKLRRSPSKSNSEILDKIRSFPRFSRFIKS